jgi:hypothetical protein
MKVDLVCTPGLNEIYKANGKAKEFIVLDVGGLIEVIFYLEFSNSVPVSVTIYDSPDGIMWDASSPVCKATPIRIGSFSRYIKIPIAKEIESISAYFK